MLEQKAKDLQMRANSLLGSKMVDVRSGNAQTAVLFRPAASTCAVFFDRTKVFSVARMLQIKYAARGDSIAEAL